MSDTWVLSFTHLKDRSRAPQALHLLQRVSSLVKPIMQKHGWKLPVLSEFFPENPSLLGLNINGGQTILIRLRPARAPDTFYDEEHLVGTMLHELTHNVHGPHDAAFYKYLSELEQEYDTLRRSGWDGEGFLSGGTRLGVGVSDDLAPHVSRQKALDAAEKRRQHDGMSSGPRRLGGSQARSNLTLRELAVQAAERRAQDEKACGQTMHNSEHEAEQAARQGVHTEAPVIDPTSDADNDVIIVDDQTSSAGPSKLTSVSKEQAASTAIQAPAKRSHSVPAAHIRPPASSSQSAPDPSAAQWPCSACTFLNAAKDSTCVMCTAPKPSPPWSCPRCTLENVGAATQCGACDGPAPRKPAMGTSQASGWVCLACGADDNLQDFWSCRLCGSIKTNS